MSNSPDWSLLEQDDNTKIHFASCSATNQEDIQPFVDASVERAIAIIPQSLRDDGRYLLFDWVPANATLTVVTTDDDKSKDAPECVQVVIENWAQQGGATQEQSAELQFWLRDYLTTSAQFLDFSLIATYCEGNRQQTRLM